MMMMTIMMIMMMVNGWSQLLVEVSGLLLVIRYLGTDPMGNCSNPPSARLSLRVKRVVSSL